MKSAYLRFLKPSFYIFLLLGITLGACEDDTPPSEALEPVIKIVIHDNGNDGNATDIEINYIQQLFVNDVKEYRAIAVKAEKAENFGLDEANAISGDNYIKIEVGEVFPVKGKVLEIDAKDSDGDVIVEGKKYRFGILSVSKDEKRISNSFAMGEEDFEIKINNQIYNYTQEIEGGAGSIALNQAGEIFVSNYDIVADVGKDRFSTFPIYKIISGGAIEEFSDSLGVPTGNAVDAQGNVYQAHLYGEHVSITSPDGDSTRLLDVLGFIRTRPEGIYIDAQDNLYVLETGNGNLIKYLPDGTATEIALIRKNPKGITGDEQGNLYISHNHEEGLITKISPTGDISTLATIPTYKPEDYVLTYKMYVGYITYHEGELYVAGTSTDRIYKVSMEGEVSVFAGSGTRGVPRGGTKNANLNRPLGLAFSQDGKRLYVSVSTDVNPTHTQSSKPGRILRVELLE